VFAGKRRRTDSFVLTLIILKARRFEFFIIFFFFWLCVACVRSQCENEKIVMQQLQGWPGPCVLFFSFFFPDVPERLCNFV